MRKCFLAFWLLAFFFGTPQVSFGADALTRMLHAEEFESFRQDQDALIVEGFSAISPV
ncbi:hypothetical protein [Desulfosporosinus sp. Sb-LF]|uniref:hypothetical protein n=1 Tax=Desulfosporosinus sp. Sb-LF TaxID=2560027 RepID=UPI00130520FA|nr:hypothetical protein [Desulfosporosinus sp. Sb-LF]